MQKRVPIISVLLICLCLPIFTFAETIGLKSGKTVEGKLIEKTDKYIKIDFQGVPLTYFFDEIESIDAKKIGYPDKNECNLPFFIEIPRAWYFFNAPGGQYIFSREQISRLGETFIVGISVFWHKDALSSSVWETLKSKQKDFFKSKGLEAADIGIDSIDRQPAFGFLVSDPGHRMFSVYIKKDADLIGIIFESSSGEWGKYEAIFRKSLNSFTFQEISNYSQYQQSPVKQQIESAKDYYNKGLSLSLNGRFEEAVEPLLKSLQINPNSAEACVALGTAYANLRQSQKAIDYFNRALEIESDFPEAFIMLGSVYADLKEYQKAREYFKKAKDSYSATENSQGAQNAKELLERLP